MTESIDLIELQKFANKGVPDIKEWETTFFDIARFPHYENVISNFYAYFLDPNEKHGLESLFLDALQEIIGTSFVFAAPEITREYYTASGMRIDVVIQGSSDESYNTIIIENKMYHHLNNDLNDYYTEFKLADEFKKGVVLTIQPLDTRDNRFVNITHNQWIDKVWEMSGTTLFSISHESLFHLKQFTTNLKNFNMAHEIGEYLDFYTDNFGFIQKVEKLKAQLEKHIWDEINRAWRLIEIPEVKFVNDHKYKWNLTYYRDEANPQVFFTISPLYINQTKPKIQLIIELNHEGLKKHEEIKALFTTSYYDEYLNAKVPEKNARWYHLVTVEKDLDKDSVENLAEFIATTINETELKTIFMKVFKFFKERNPQQPIQ